MEQIQWPNGSLKAWRQWDQQNLFYSTIPATPSCSTSKTSRLAFKSQRCKVWSWSNQNFFKINLIALTQDIQKRVIRSRDHKKLKARFLVTLLFSLFSISPSWNLQSHMCYEVKGHTRGISWQQMLIDDIITLLIWPMHIWHPFLTISTQKNVSQFFICVNLYQIYIKKLRLFHLLTCRNSWFQNPPRTRFFPIMKFNQERSAKYNSSSWNKFSDQMVL